MEQLSSPNKKQVTGYRLQGTGKTFKKVVIVIFILFTVNCQLSPVTCLYAAFKDIGWGVRPCGMGGAFTGLANDANAPLWNPAGTCQLEEREGTFAYTIPYAGLDGVNLRLGYFSFVWPLSTTLGSVGINWAGLFEPNYQENTGLINYSTRLNNFFKLKWDTLVGFNLKYLHHRFILDDHTKNIGYSVFANRKNKGAFTMDFGTIVAPMKKLTVGLMAKNVIPADVGLESEDKVPMEFRIGGSYKIGDLGKIEEITPALDFTYRLQEWGDTLDKMNIHLGIESWFGLHTYGVRVGGNLNEVTMGASFNKFISSLSIQIDYAFTFSLKIADNFGTHRIATTFRF